MGQHNPVGVPAVDSARNKTFLEVIGNKSDTHGGTSAMSRLNSLDAHAHGQSKVFPTMADGVVVTATTNDWTDLGAFAEIAAANDIAEAFSIHYISVENISANGVYELVLYAVEVEIGRRRFTQNAVQDSVINIPFQTDVVAANTQIQAKLASDNAVADTVTISLGYHPHA